MPQPTIFISYSHLDEEEKNRLLTHLGVLERAGLIDLWNDDRIGAGRDWQQEIQAAMGRAKMAVLLVTANFLTSNFILGTEVPELLRRRQREGLTVFPIIARACAWRQVDWLAALNVKPKNGRPVWSDGGSHVDEDLAAIAEGIAAIVKNSATPPPVEGEPTRDLILTPPLTTYLQTMAGQCTRLTLAPLDPTGRESAHLTLEQVYVGLDARTPRPTPFQGQPGEVRSVLAAVAQQPRLVILGDPGSGKSTFLRFLALRLAQARLDPDGDWLAHLSWPVYPAEREHEMRLRPAESDETLGTLPWSQPAYIPLLVTLRDFAATDFEPNSPLALWRFIETNLMAQGLAESIPVIRDILGRGQAILLLDGVDEVPLDRRPQVWQAIGALAAGAFNRCRWVVTCRMLSYVEAEAAPAAATDRVTLAPLNQTQITAFVQGWYQTLIKEGQLALAKGESLQNQLSRAATGKLQELAENPMLLTIMALVQTYYGTLPQERAKLYQACVETLLLRWQRSKEAEESQLPTDLAALELKQELIEPLLWEIGWVAHAEQAERQGAADISEAQVIELAKKHLGSYAKAEAFVEYTERRAHLLIGRGGQAGRRYSFPHRTFQEYLAGCHLANDRRFGRKATPLAEQGAPWREVLLLAAGTLVYNQKVGRYVLDALEDILPAGQPEPGNAAGWQRAWRAGEMLALVGVAAAKADEVGREILPLARQYLAALLAGGELTPPERAEAGQALAVLGDPRPGVGLIPSTIEGERPLPDLLWRPVPAGEFIMGDDAGRDEEKPAHRVNLAAFEISQYPITNRQFQAFVADGGYGQAQYWRGAEAAGYWQNGQFKGLFDNEPRRGPYDFGAPYHLPNHPVVGASWYEAVAFCRWLSNRLGYLVRLPTEAEWEKAARGPEGQPFPWGSSQAEVSARGNMADSGLGATCAVGIFPTGLSPYGLLDMSGNVWEWCSTIWADKAYPFKIREEWTEDYLDQDEWRVLRGGAYFNDSGRVRCAARIWNSPDYGSDNCGFRVVRPPK